MLIAVCSLKASPGVTTLALALGALWPAGAEPIVVEADPAGGDLAARFQLATTPGLVGVAAALRRTDDPALLHRHAHRFPGGLPVVLAPPTAEQASAALHVVADRGAILLRRAAAQPAAVVIVDCGRVEPGSVTLPILRAADVMVLLARPSSAELARLALMLPVVSRWSPRPRLILLGPGYRPEHVRATLGIPVLATVPHDDKGASVLNGAIEAGACPARSLLGQAASRIAMLVTTEVRDRAPVGAAPQSLPPRPRSTATIGVPAHPARHHPGAAP
ncbi:chromosome partitioning protein [Crossiella sp. SN42]|uniref:chromosome partitioning protein n=1 Tax=Crossiella sp. SN42 TaxID=2944808 RepID=UPI00207CF897|nr:chromosome partitioning protein [Crossiella sp. SN42]MCO1575875.1 chromosome partitioning protein [Crossiella sp. SN42]